MRSNRHRDKCLLEKVNTEGQVVDVDIEHFMKHVCTAVPGHWVARVRHID